MRIVFVYLALAACTLPPPRATVSFSPLGATSPLRKAVLVLPTTCVADADYLCKPAGRVRESDRSPTFPVASTFASLIDPLVRLKLELAGLTLADAGTLRLQSADRVDRSETRARDGYASAGSSTSTSDAPTVLSLSADERAIAAHSIGLHATLSSTLRIQRAKYAQQLLELTLELRAIPGDAPLWTVRCSELLEDVEATAQLLANCVGDGVLASLAPDAAIRKPL